MRWGVPVSGENDFGDVFDAALLEIRSNAKKLGVPLSEICSAVGISRATPSRYKARRPATVVVVQKLQAEINKRLLQQNAGCP